MKQPGWQFIRLMYTIIQAQQKQVLHYCINYVFDICIVEYDAGTCWPIRDSCAIS